MSTPDYPYERCVVRIWIDGKVEGTGFVIGPGTVLTCAHVVHDTDKPLEGHKSISIEFYGVHPGLTSEGSPALQSVKIDPGHFSPGDQHDIAILTWEGELPAGVTVAEFSFDEQLAGRKVRTRGFPQLGEFDSQPGTGTIQGTTTHSPTSGEHWALNSAEITNGFSGAPIFDENSGCVVAMARSVIAPDTYWRNKTTAIGIKVQTIKSVCKDLIRPVVSNRVEKLKELVIKILQDEEPTRRVILAANYLARDLSAEELANRMFAVKPEFRDSGAHHTPMCFLHKCCNGPGIAEKEPEGILNHLGRLAAILAPVSF
ncbi:MAG: serine protease, partial [Planctomycetia bacterium]